MCLFRLSVWRMCNHSGCIWIFLPFDFGGMTLPWYCSSLPRTVTGAVAWELRFLMQSLLCPHHSDAQHGVLLFCPDLLCSVFLRSSAQKRLLVGEAPRRKGRSWKHWAEEERMQLNEKIFGLEPALVGWTEGWGLKTMDKSRLRLADISLNNQTPQPPSHLSHCLDTHPVESMS